MKETKLPAGCKDNPVSASDGSFSLPKNPQSLNGETPGEALKKKFATNRGAFSGPLETDEQRTELLESENKAEEGCNDAASEAQA